MNLDSLNLTSNNKEERATILCVSSYKSQFSPLCIPLRVRGAKKGTLVDDGNVSRHLDYLHYTTYNRGCQWERVDSVCEGKTKTSCIPVLKYSKQS